MNSNLNTRGTVVRSIGGSVFSYNGNITEYNDIGYGRVPGYSCGKAIGYYDVSWASRAVVVTGSGV